MANLLTHILAYPYSWGVFELADPTTPMPKSNDALFIYFWCVEGLVPVEVAFENQEHVESLHYINRSRRNFFCVNIHGAWHAFEFYQ